MKSHKEQIMQENMMENILAKQREEEIIPEQLRRSDAFVHFHELRIYVM